MDKGFSSDCVDLGEACKVLAKNHSVVTLLKKEVGDKDFPQALEMMKSGKLDGDLGASVHDFFLDSINNEAVPIWSGFIFQDNDRWPIRVNEYHGIFWVWALESESVGYFLDANRAISFARSNWENVYEDGEDPEENAEIRCPFCDTTDNCDHLLLLVDETFRQAEGGMLYEAFNAKWAKIVTEADDPDFDEREPFDDLLDEVDSLADSQLTASPDSVPGMSSNYSYFYCSSKAKTMAALKKFT
jgi:hypothetical protein